MTAQRLAELARECWSASLEFGAMPCDRVTRGERILDTAEDIGPAAAEARDLAIAAIHLKERSMRARGTEP